MLLHLSSNNPDDYSTLQFNTSLRLPYNRIQYRISSISTICSFSITTSDDYIEAITADGIAVKYIFGDVGSYHLDTLVYSLNQIMARPVYTGDLVNPDTTPVKISVVMNTAGLLSFVSDTEFSITRMTHRVQLLTGCYHCVFPLQSSNMKISINAIPFVCFGNILYLRCRTESIAITNNWVDSSDEQHPIAYKSIELLYPGLPIVCKTPGNIISSTIDQFNHMEFQLVDFQLHPIILHCPLHITIEVFTGIDQHPPILLA